MSFCRYSMDGRPLTDLLMTEDFFKIFSGEESLERQVFKDFFRTSIDESFRSFCVKVFRNLDV